MKRLIMTLLATATLFTGAAAADAQRWHGDHRGHGYHRGHDDRRWHDRRHHRRAYWYYRNGHRIRGWR